MCRQIFVGYLKWLISCFPQGERKNKFIHSLSRIVLCKDYFSPSEKLQISLPERKDQPLPPPKKNGIEVLKGIMLRS